MTSPRILALVLLLLVLAGLPAMLLMSSTSRGPATPEAEPVGVVYPPDAEVRGASLGEWHGRYWRWITSLPVAENPAQDPTGERCGHGQDGPVFFVPGNMPPCNVPADTPIFLPIAGTECSTLEPEPFHGENEDELAACAAADAERYTNISFMVDGEAVPGIGEYRAPSPAFDLDVPPDNILAVPEGSGRAVADGYAVILAPLPPGEHEIVVHVEVVDGYALPDTTLRLTVLEADLVE